MNPKNLIQKLFWYLLSVNCYLSLAICDLLKITCFLSIFIWNYLSIGLVWTNMVIYGNVWSCLFLYGLVRYFMNLFVLRSYARFVLVFIQNGFFRRFSVNFEQENEILVQLCIKNKQQRPSDAHFEHILYFCKHAEIWICPYLQYISWYWPNFDQTF